MDEHLEEVEARLRALAPPLPAPPTIPTSVDAAVTLAARAAAGRARRRRAARWTGAAAVAAAAALLVFAVRRPADPRDVNRDGAVDILDAFAVARAIERGAPPPAYDLNGDGVVDAADVELAAHAAVALGGG